MKSIFTLLSVAALAAAFRAPALAPLRSPVAARAPIVRAQFIPPIIESDDDDDFELDDLEGCESWEEAMADQKRWEEEMARKNQQDGFGSGNEISTPVAAVSDFVPVDEQAHFDLDDDDETPQERSIRQQAEKQAAVLIERAQAAATPPDMQRVMTSLEAVIATMMRLESKVDTLSKKVDALQTSALSTGAAAATSGATGVPMPPPAASPFDGWDGEVDEDAWQIDDPEDSDLPDWRDVRAAKAQAAADDADTPPAPPPPPPPPPPASSPAAPPAAAPPAGGWDGEIDEMAYFDDDPDEDLADWRDVRRLKKLFDEQTAEKDDPPVDEGGEK